MHAKLFQYAVLWHPTKKQHEDEGKRTRVAVELQTVLAADDRAAALIAARSIPEDLVAEIDQLEVVVRPF